MGRRAWWLIDGLPHWLLTMAVAKAPERLEAFAAAIRQDRLVPLMPLAPNCQTPPSLAALYCGRQANETGLCGFDLPNFDTNGLGLQKAFDRGPGDWPRIWDEEREGRGLRLLHVPYVGADTASRAVTYINGFGSPIVAPAVLEPSDALECYGIAPSGPTWEAFETGSGSRSLAARVNIDGVARVVLLGSWPVEGGATPFMATGLQHSYRRGDLGRTLMQGGNGVAEQLFVDSLRQMSRHYNQLWMAEFRAGPLDDIYGYQPALDLALHELIGYVAPDCGHWQPERANCVLPLLIDMLADFDQVLRHTRQEAGPNDRVIVCSDHGMMPVDTLARPNQALRQLGLLTTDDEGKIDTLQSQMWLHPTESGLLCLRADAAGNLDGMLERLTAALTSQTGRQAQIAEDRGLEMRLAPPKGILARHFLWAGPRCQIRADFDGPVTEPTLKTGEHVVTGPDPSLRGVVIDLSATPVLLPDTAMETWQVSFLFTTDAVSVVPSRASTL
ncbi:MAG: hypothetical protein GQ535_03520 [Rhodobacteraceae bacterium]|nr:hypothetical protein [Paracoccaceae bacterium]